MPKYEQNESANIMSVTTNSVYIMLTFNFKILMLSNYCLTLIQIPFYYGFLFIFHCLLNLESVNLFRILECLICYFEILL